MDKGVTPKLVCRAYYEISAVYEIAVYHEISCFPDIRKVFVGFTCNAQDVGSFLMDTPECLGCTVDSLIPQPLGILSERLWGDVNRDGTVNINDVTALQGHIAELDKLDAESILTGDINGDGVTDIGDATEIQRFLAEMTDKFPVES